MLPPIPPPMPSCPGTPPWQQTAGEDAKPNEGAKLEATAPAQAPPAQGVPPGAFGAPGPFGAPGGFVPPQVLPQLRPGMLHGLVPPQMLGPTYPGWIGPTDQRQTMAYLLGHYHAVQAQEQRRMIQAQHAYQLAQLQAAQAQQQRAQAQQVRPAGQPPVQMERTEPQKNSVQYQPVQPVAGVNEPHGARHRGYWMGR